MNKQHLSSVLGSVSIGILTYRFVPNICHMKVQNTFPFLLYRERWISILHHVTNKHEWSGSSKFSRCGHAPLSDDTRNKAWLKPDSPSFLALKAVVLEKRLLSACPKLAQFCHTGNLEVFHSMLLKYLPKRQHFTYEGMYW